MKRKTKISLFIAHVISIVGGTSTFLQTPTVFAAQKSSLETSETEATQSEWQKIRQKIRIRSFTEFMTPAFDNHSNSIPYEDGSKLLPTNTFNLAWIDYEIAPDLKIVYYQRLNINFADSEKRQAVNAVPRNPRFALRKVNVFNISHLTTSYDFYVQPGLAPEANGAGRNLEFGIRTATSYAFPRSKWSVGATSETTVAFSFKPAPEGSSSFYGWLLPWASYELSSVFSTQHYLSASFQHIRGTFGIQPDYPMPLAIQNGIGINLSETIWASVFLNNYINTLPTLANTWMSVWLSVNIL